MPETPKSVRVRSSTDPLDLPVTVMVGNEVIRVTGWQAAVVLLAALNGQAINQPYEYTEFEFHATARGVTLKLHPTVDYLALADPAETVTRFRKRQDGKVGGSTD